MVVKVLAFDYLSAFGRRPDSADPRNGPTPETPAVAGDSDFDRALAHEEPAARVLVKRRHLIGTGIVD
jgi:hypothetical protein